MGSKYVLAVVAALSAGAAACGSDAAGGGSGGSAGSATGGGAGSGAGGSGAGGSAGSGSGGSAGSATGGGSGSGGNGGSAGSGGSPGACGDIPTFADGLSPGAEVHVSPSGNDANDGSLQSPVQTIEKAAQLAAPGTAILLHAGTYPGGSYIDDLAGTAAAPIWLGGAPGESAVIEGGGEALHLSQVRYLVVHDLEVRGTTQNGINIDDGGETANGDATRFVLFRSLNVHDVGGSGNQDCLKMSGVNDFWVIDSQFARCGGGMSGSGIDHVGCHRGVIARNAFDQMSGNAVQSKGGSEDIEIRWNLMTNAGERAVNMGGSTGFQFFRPPLSSSAPNFEARNIRVIANVIVGSTAPIAFVGCVDCLAANNTLVNPTNWILRILQETTTGGGYTFLPAQNGRFVNNLVYFDRSDLSTWVNVGADTDAGSFHFDNNLWYAHDDPGQSAPGNLPAPETGAVAGQDPQLQSPGGGDFHIPATSPATGAGTAVSGVVGDRDGVCYAAPPSIGAHEVP